MVHSRESEEQNQYIRDDKELVHVQLRKLKAQRTQAREISQENLVKLTLESNATIKALRKIVDKVTKGRGWSKQNQGTWLLVKWKGFEINKRGFLLLPAWVDTWNTFLIPCSLPSHVLNELILNELCKTIKYLE